MYIERERQSNWREHLYSAISTKRAQSALQGVPSQQQHVTHRTRQAAIEAQVQFFPDKDNAVNGQVLILHLSTVRKCEQRAFSKDSTLRRHRDSNPQPKSCESKRLPLDHKAADC